jgi:two-component sensor histidine kinase
MENLVGGAGGDGIELRVDACALSVGLDFAIPLGLVVTEIVTNALKHAFPDGVGVVRVSLGLDGDDVLLTVGDNGPGFADAPGPAAAGVGSGLIRRLVAQLDGDLAIRQEAGTTFEIRLPLPETA